ncbi:hypothetical protein Smp_123970 [Schistosoma mansoni]|uniref:hypothetical protein n=1 Tax=Schistosoma mansoni TaxID=6183 RepID=UPI0001A64105|nr:hypothetical protein Smp_123970 [Schistosoma mansoni]|eukprot:XP_018647683.1 hypothetical protein Smp_123970 [Schistosoma mansoni]
MKIVEEQTEIDALVKLKGGPEENLSWDPEWRNNYQEEPSLSKAFSPNMLLLSESVRYERMILIYHTKEKTSSLYLNELVNEDIYSVPLWI